VCSNMIEECFRSCTISTCAKARPITIRRSQGFHESDINIIELTESSSICEFCDFILSVLRGSSGILLAQAKAYEDDEYNPVDFYDENGISDYDAQEYSCGKKGLMSSWASDYTAQARSSILAS
jgi:hypothetical protein